MSALSNLLSGSAVRSFAVVGDAMAPDLRHGDFLMVAPADRYAGEGVYLLDFDDGESPFVAQRRIGSDEVQLRRVNPAYADHTVSVDQFSQACRAVVVADVRMRADLRTLVGGSR